MDNNDYKVIPEELIDSNDYELNIEDMDMVRAGYPNRKIALEMQIEELSQKLINEDLTSDQVDSIEAIISELNGELELMKESMGMTK